MSEFMQGALVGAGLVAGAVFLGRWIITPTRRPDRAEQEQRDAATT